MKSHIEGGFFIRKIWCYTQLLLQPANHGHAGKSRHQLHWNSAWQHAGKSGHRPHQ